jgi:hypothetical protein
MSDALKSRLSAERLFTATDMRLAAKGGYLAGYSARDRGVPCKAGTFADTMADEYLSRVKTHLTSDTTTIRPRKA